MYQRDYLLRMIEMLGDLIAGLLGKIRKGEIQQAREEMDRLYTDFLKEDSALFLALPPEKLTDSLLKEHNYTYGHLEILAMLFGAEAELAIAERRLNDAIELSEKTIILYNFIATEKKTFSFDNEKKVADIRKRITDLENEISKQTR
jgi:hypothetical protein